MHNIHLDNFSKITDNVDAISNKTNEYLNQSENGDPDCAYKLIYEINQRAREIKKLLNLC